MDTATLVAVVALFGTLVNAWILVYSNKRSHRRGMVDAAITSATAEFEAQHRVAMWIAEKGRGSPKVLPFAAYLHWHMRVAELAEEGRLNPGSIERLYGEQELINKVIEKQGRPANEKSTP